MAVIYMQMNNLLINICNQLQLITAVTRWLNRRIVLLQQLIKTPIFSNHRLRWDYFQEMQPQIRQKKHSIYSKTQDDISLYQRRPSWDSGLNVHISTCGRAKTLILMH